jgi:nucleoside phosphorylase
LIITTGTGGGIGSDIKLGDVIIGGAVRFHCTKQFADSAFKEAIFETTKFGKSAFELITAEMRDANAEEFNAENASPLKFAYPGSAVHKTPKIVTTDFFEFDDTLDSAHLQALGQACDMGDASLGLALDTLAHPPKWTAIRNASDGQMDGTLSKEEQRQKAAAIYKRYGLYTSVGSILATWAVIRDSFPDAAASTAATAVTTTADTAATYNGATTALAETSLSMQARSRVPRPHSTSESLLLTLLAGSERQSTDATGAVVSSAVSETIKRTLPSGLQDLTMLAKEYTFVDELRQERRVQLVNASASVPLSCRGTYVFENENLVCKLVVPETPEGK